MPSMRFGGLWCHFNMTLFSPLHPHTAAWLLTSLDPSAGQQVRHSMVQGGGVDGEEGFRSQGVVIRSQGAEIRRQGVVIRSQGGELQEERRRGVCQEQPALLHAPRPLTAETPTVYSALRGQVVVPPLHTPAEGGRTIEYLFTHRNQNFLWSYFHFQ